MDRRDARETWQKRMALAIGASIAAHAVALSIVRLELPVLVPGDAPRPLRLVELPDEWRASALEVIPLESALESAAASGAPSAPRARPHTPAPSGSEAVPARLATRPTASAATTAAALDLTPAAESAAPAAEIAAARPARGIVLRADAAEAGHGGLDFYAASDAAREAEDERGGASRGGRGVGISIAGPGGHCPTGGGIPAIGIGGGLGGVPTIGKGMGILGARPPNRGAINRFGPQIGPGRSP